MERRIVLSIQESTTSSKLFFSATDSTDIRVLAYKELAAHVLARALQDAAGASPTIAGYGLSLRRQERFFRYQREARAWIEKGEMSPWVEILGIDVKDVQKRLQSVLDDEALTRQQKREALRLFRKGF